MSENFFNVTISGEETLINDLNDFVYSLRDPVWYGLSAVADGMTNSLQAHIQRDVYDAYEPKSYPRRSRGNGVRFGLPLNDIHQMVVDHPTALSMSFTYEPSGYHSGKMQDALDAYNSRNEPRARTEARWNQPLKPNPVHGDALIRRIQTGRGYDWKPPAGMNQFPARPFWDNFVEEQKNGAIMDNFAYGISREVSDFQLEGGDKDIQWGASEGMLESTSHDYSLLPGDQISIG